MSEELTGPKFGDLGQKYDANRQALGRNITTCSVVPKEIDGKLGEYVGLGSQGLVDVSADAYNHLLRLKGSNPVVDGLGNVELSIEFKDKESVFQVLDGLKKIGVQTADQKKDFDRASNIGEMGYGSQDIKDVSGKVDSRKNQTYVIDQGRQIALFSRAADYVYYPGAVYTYSKDAEQLTAQSFYADIHLHQPVLSDGVSFETRESDVLALGYSDKVPMPPYMNIKIDAKQSLKVGHEEVPIEVKGSFQVDEKIIPELQNALLDLYSSFPDQKQDSESN